MPFGKILKAVGKFANPLAAVAGSVLGAVGASKSLTAAEKQYDLQRTQSIQDRVADARKAGIHPLYALGASPAASPTIGISGQTSVGSALGEGIQMAAQAYQASKSPGKAQQQASIRAVNASAARDEAQAALYNSQRKRLEQQPPQQTVKPALNPMEIRIKGRPPLLGQEGSTGATSVFGPITKNPYSTTDQIKQKSGWGDEVADMYDVLNWLSGIYEKFAPYGAYGRASASYLPPKK